MSQQRFSLQIYVEDDGKVFPHGEPKVFHARDLDHAEEQAKAIAKEQKVGYIRAFSVGPQNKLYVYVVNDKIKR
jgi:hypothetical protein